jgi:hypothetical protein
MMPDPDPTLIRPPKQSVFEQTLSGLEPGPDQPRERRGVLARLFRRERRRTAPAPGPELPSPVAAVPSLPPSRPKTSIFDQTLPGVEPPVAATTQKLMVEGSGPLSPYTAPDPSHYQTRIFQAPPEPPVSGGKPYWEEDTLPQPLPPYPELAGETEIKPEAELLPAPEAARVAPGAPARVAPAMWVLVGAGALGLAVAIGFYVGHRQAGPVPLSVEEAPESLKPYLVRAQTGDVAAMRMIGLRYAYGIGVPVNPREGAFWLRKAAMAGNETARQELDAMGREGQR